METVFDIRWKIGKKIKRDIEKNGYVYVAFLNEGLLYTRPPLST